MAFLVPNKPDSSSVYDGANEISAGQGSPVSNCLLIRSDAGAAGGTSGAARQLLDKDIVLRRIRSHKRASQNDTALRPLARASQDLVAGDVHGPSSVCWLDDALSSP